MDHSFHRSFSPQLEDDWTYDDEQYAHSDDHLVRDDYDDHNDYEEYQEEYEVTRSDHVQSPPDGGDDPWKGVWGEDREQGSRHDNLSAYQHSSSPTNFPRRVSTTLGWKGLWGGEIPQSCKGLEIQLQGNYWH